MKKNKKFTKMVQNMDKLLNVGIVIERLKSHLGVKTDTDLAKLMNMKQTTLSSWKGRNSFDVNELYAFCVENKINFHWLLTGEEIRQEENKSWAQENIETYLSEIDSLQNELKKIDSEISKDYDEITRKNLEIDLLRAKLSTIERLLKLI